MNSLDPLHDSSGTSILAAADDAQIARALHESTARFREAFTYAAIGMALVALDGRWLHVNATLCSMLGYTTDELVGLTFQDVTHPDDLSADLEQVGRLLAGDIPAYHMEKRYRHKRGTMLWALLSVSLVRDTDGRPLYFISQIQDISARKHAELALAEREAWFRALYEQSPDAILLIDPHDLSGEWPIVECNPAACTMNGYAHAELMGQPISLLEAEPSSAGERAALLERLRRERDVRFDVMHRRKDGSLFPVLVSATVLTVAGREYVIGIDRDMSVLKQAEQARATSEERYRGLVEHLPAVVYTARLDHTSSTSYVSPQIERILGFTPEEWMADPTLWLAQVHPDDRDMVLSDAMQAHQADLPHPVEFRAYARDGRLVWLRDMAWLVRDALGRPQYLQGLTLDITDRKQAEEAARSSARVYRTLAQNFPHGAVFLFDHELRYTLADGQALRMFGMTREDVEGRTLFEVLSPERAAFQEPHYRAALAGEHRTVELAIGERRYITYYLPVFDEAQHVTAGMVVSHDITERSRAEQALLAERAHLARRVEERTADLQAANAALARAARMKDEFLANMSHELRTPLTAILGFAEGLHEQAYGPVTDRQVYALRAIEDSGRHLLSLITDILDVAKIGAGKLELNPTRMSVSEVCDASVRMVRHTALKKGVELRCEIDPAVTSLSADSRRLKQMLVNLLSNAVKFTGAGGSVGLSVIGDPAANELRFTVSDTGIGIAADKIPQLFQPFVQLDSNLDRQYEGNGLGLVLVARLTELHGGGVAVESEPGVGSRFTITLPWRAAAAAGADAAGESLAELGEGSAGERGVPTKDGTILLVDDSEKSAQAIAEYLTAIGHRVVLAHSGEDAIAIARAIQLSLVLMDIQMPKMDGLETTRHLRRLATQRDTPVIALTALAMPGDRERCLEAGVDGYMSKPVRLRELRTMIDRLIARA